MAFEMTTEFLPSGGNINARVNPRPVRPNAPPPQANMPVPPGGAPAQPQRPVFTPPNDNPNAAFNRPDQANEHARFNRPVEMAQGPQGQYADNPPGQRPAAVNAMVGGQGDDNAMRMAARGWANNLMQNNPELFRRLMQRRAGMQPGMDPGSGPRPMPPGYAPGVPPINPTIPLPGSYPVKTPLPTGGLLPLPPVQPVDPGFDMYPSRGYQDALGQVGGYTGGSPAGYAMYPSNGYQAMPQDPGRPYRPYDAVPSLQSLAAPFGVG